MLRRVVTQGDLLIDGGYLNNMPVDVMHAMGMLYTAHTFMSRTWHICMWSLTAYDVRAVSAALRLAT